MNQSLRMAMQEGKSSQNRRLGLALASLALLYIGAVIAFIIAY